MKRLLRSLLIFASIFLCMSITHAEDKIEEAFGKKLGDTFDIAMAIGTAALTDGTVMYQFTPQNPFRSLTQYYVLITPTTNKIYSIWGMGNLDNTATGKKEQDVLMELLTQKYGAQNEEGLFDALYDTKQISKGNRTVLTKVTGFMDATLEIRYYDYDIEKVAEKERLVIEAKKAGGAGL